MSGAAPADRAPETFKSIETLACQARARAAYWHAITQIAPQSDPWFRSHLVRLIMGARGNPDMLLIVADSLEEASTEAANGGQLTLTAELHALADLPRQLAGYFGADAFRRL